MITKDNIQKVLLDLKFFFKSWCLYQTFWLG